MNFVHLCFQLGKASPSDIIVFLIIWKLRFKSSGTLQTAVKWLDYPWPCGQCKVNPTLQILKIHVMQILKWWASSEGGHWMIKSWKKDCDLWLMALDLLLHFLVLHHDMQFRNSYMVFLSVLQSQFLDDRLFRNQPWPDMVNSRDPPDLKMSIFGLY